MSLFDHMAAQDQITGGTYAFSCFYSINDDAGASQRHKEAQNTPNDIS